jgi:hypothetical protein
MIVLAGIEGNLVFLIVAAAVGVINWLMEKKKKAGSESPRPPAAPMQTTTSPGADSEQERLRRFMEALGVPQPQQQQPQRQVPASAKPQAPQRNVVRTRERQQQFAKPTPKPARKPAPPVYSEPEEMTRAGRLEEAATSIERISGEFDAINVHVAMPSVQATAGTAKNAGTTNVLERDGNPLVASLRRTLTNPTDIRAAFLAAELLGPPRGLQG